MNLANGLIIKKGGKVLPVVENNEDSEETFDNIDNRFFQPKIFT